MIQVTLYLYIMLLRLSKLLFILLTWSVHFHMYNVRECRANIQFLPKNWPVFLQRLSKLHLRSVSSVCLCQVQEYFKQHIWHMTKRKSLSVWYKVRGMRPSWRKSNNSVPLSEWRWYSFCFNDLRFEICMYYIEQLTQDFVHSATR